MNMNPLLHTCTRLLVLVLAMMAVFQIGLFYVVLNNTGTFQIKNDPLGRLSIELKLAIDSVSKGEHSLDLARDLRERARIVEDSAPLQATQDLDQAIEIERSLNSKNLHSSLDSMELVTTLEQQAAIKTKLNKPQEAINLLKEAFSLIKKDNLYWMKSPVVKLEKLLEGNGQKREAIATLTQMQSMEKSPLNELQKYLSSRERWKNVVPSGLTHGAAIPFVADYNRMMERDFVLAERPADAMKYAENCVEFDSLLPESGWQTPTNLADLALIYTEMGRYKQASDTYDKCVRVILDSVNPDVLYVLPQVQSSAHLAVLLKNTDDLTHTRGTADDISKFLLALRSEQEKLATNHKWVIGDLIQARWDDRWWSARIVDSKQGSYKIHFIGFPTTQDDWFAIEDIRQHPPYGYGELQNEVPVNAWNKKADG